MLRKFSKIKRIRTHGFRSKSASVLNARRRKGRKRLATTVHAKK
ncbi:MAG: 50S ribosomal protein L34 [Candidatus Gracilibacteria bacterium]